MKLQHHTAVTLYLSGLIFVSFKSWILALTFLITGIFIDLDHVFDYLREHGWPLNIKNFFRVCHQGDFLKIVLFMHGWEWMLAAWAAAWISNWNLWITGVSLGYSQHLILDSLYNSPSFWSYSIVWRWKQGFDYDTIFGKRIPRLTNRA